MTGKPILISVVRDEAMYRRCIVENKFCNGCELMKFGNRVKNEFISVLYNRALDELDYTTPRWLVFAHEDFEAREPLAAKLAEADLSRIYGVIGGVLKPRECWLLGGIWPGAFVGQIEQTSKNDDSNVIRVGTAAPMNTEVETVDCLFLAIHSSLVERFRLRFDEHLSFDLYVEDFCINAFVRHQVKTVLLPLVCRHHSSSKAQPRFFKQLAYLNQKYPTSEFFCSVGYTIGKGRTALRRWQKRVRAFLDRHLQFAVRWYFKFVD